MKIVSPKQMRNIDDYSINMGIPSLLLMENAACAVVNALPPEAERFLVFCGKGNNGGDGYAAARLLHTAGKRVDVVTTEPPVSGDALVNFELAQRINIPIIPIEQVSTDKYDVVIDALLGTGISAQVQGVYKHAVELINNSGKTVVSVDIPSGIDGYNGTVRGCAVKADITVTFGLPKFGLAANDYTGKLIVAPISIPRQAIDAQNIKTRLTTAKYVKRLIPKRFSNSHKGTYGKLVILAGSTGMTGAAALCTRAALRTGAGMVWLGIPENLNNVMEQAVTEAMTIPLPQKDGALTHNGYSTLNSYLEKADALLFGCGLSAKESIYHLLLDILANTNIPMIIDADGLNALSKDISRINGRTNTIITPHPVEFSRLSGIPLEDIELDRIGCAMNFASRYKVVTVLKGAGTVIASPEGDCFVNPTGNPGMATGGSGDVLSGIIAALAGQGARPFDAAVAGVYIHGMCGDMAASQMGMHGTLPTDMIDNIGMSISALLT